MFAHISHKLQPPLAPALEAIAHESKQWKNLLAQELREKNKKVMEEISDFISDHIKTLNRKLQDLDDVRLAMTCLDEISQVFYQFDKSISTIEENYALLYKFNIEVPFEEMERVEGVRYNFTNMMSGVKICYYFPYSS